MPSINLTQLRKELGIPTFREKYTEPTVTISASFLLPKSIAKKLFEKMQEDGNLTLGFLMKRLIRFYIADHEGYKPAK